MKQEYMNPSKVHKWCIVLLVFCVTALLSSLLPVNAFAQEQSRIVTIGWYQSDLFQEGMSDDAVKSGYSYEYIHKVADYNGWTYRYVYGDWTELYAKLLSGEIDLLAGVSKTEDRMDKILYPNEVMGYETYVLYKHAEDNTLDASNLSSFTGKKLGGITDNLMTERMEAWVEENQLDAQIVYYSSFEERDSDFVAGKLDALVTTDNSILLSSGYAKLAKVGDEPYYLAVSMGNTEILSELNKALASMQDLEPYFINDLEFRNYGATMTNSTLSEQEEDWLSGHSEVLVGYLNNYLPYCTTDENGNAYGLVTNVINASFEKLNLRDRLVVRYVAFDSGDEMVSALKQGVIDAAFPVSGDSWQLEQQGIKASNTVVASSVNLVYIGAYSERTVAKIGVTKGNTLMRNYIASVFPQADLVEYDTTDDCLQAVMRGEIGSTTINSFREDLINKNRRYRTLILKRLDKTDSRCFGVAGDDTGLLMLLNRGLKLIGQNYGSTVSYDYMADLYQVTVLDFIGNHPWLSAGIVFLLITVILIASIYIQYRTRKFLKQEEAKNKELSVKQGQLEEANAEQQAQLEEITSLNAQLEDNQAELTRAKEAAEAANNAKTSFLFNMSHDIRTPMNAIMGFRDLLEKHQDEPEKRQDYLKKIEDASTVLLSIINNVLEMARIEKGTIEIDETAWSAEQFNDTLYSVFNEMMKTKGLTFIRQIEVQNDYVFCDPIKLREIFINILSNAYKYTNPGGRVNMLLEEIPSNQQGWALYRTTITDTGIGMSEEFLPHLFEEFSREKNTTDAKIEGTGLGMSIVKRLVEMLDGTIEVRSKKGEGSTFIVTIPHKIADKSCLVEHAGVEVDPKLFAGKRILLAEDNDLNAEIAMEILGEVGFIIDRAEDGAICVDMLEKAGSGYYDLILMDIQMPNMNGYAATRVIRQMGDSSKANIKILAMTANAFEEDKREAFRSGMNGHLAKPINVNELMKTLARII